MRNTRILVIFYFAGGICLGDNFASEARYLFANGKRVVDSTVSGMSPKVIERAYGPL
ncbi:hypothetical protein LZ24_02828 [Desulfobotulus alkaliphilus]|uniref:Uncharacterized protein n=1 Tax=Desulfobotulus alkaliphilus TaxID=622671 RepID=A0A562RCY0_9BACT|nr:hypothetical protein LZ24_02828 [Desulfobotulus alkaliphilus]